MFIHGNAEVGILLWYFIHWDGGMAQTKICRRVGYCGFISNLNTKTHDVIIHGNAEAGIPLWKLLRGTLFIEDGFTTNLTLDPERDTQLVL